MYANVVEGDVWERALTAIAGAHRAAGPAGRALGSLAKDSCCGVLQGSPESSASAFPSRWVDLY